MTQLRGQWVTFAQAAREAYQRAKQPVSDLIHPGFDPIFRSVGYFEPGDLMVIGAGTNVGKTFMSLTLLLGMHREGVIGGMVTCEDPVHRIGSRILQSSCGGQVPSLALKLRQTSAYDTALQDALADLESLDLPLYRPATDGVQEVSDAVRAMAERGCRVVVVDYAQHIEDDLDQVAEEAMRHRAMKRILCELKKVASECSLVVILTSQFSRSPTSSGKPREPVMADLAEASALEQKAELVMLMWLELESDAVQIREKRVCCHIAKAKDGWIGNDRFVCRRLPSGLFAEDSWGLPDEDF